MWWGIYNDGWWGWGAGHMLVGAAFWVLFVAAAVWVVRRLNGGPPAGAAESALDVLKKRYARGEIESEEFTRKKRELSE